ncbi:MFS transporter [Campylobacter cuniculorum]|uniref:MFS transporter n=1 Tax=Campylobacter cuniculorum TaxID=374106 RepID=UPI0023F4FDBB|nr:MFS transporter [Campylobacter cuniculorum]
MSPKRIIRSMTALFAGISFMFIGNGLIVSSAGVILKQQNLDSLTIGAINSFFFIGAMFGTIFAQKIITQIGYIRSFGIFAAIFGSSAILHILSENLIFWAFLRFLIGVCYYSLLIITESWLNEKAKNSVRSRILSFYEVIFYLSFGLGILIFSLNLDKITIFISSAVLILLSSIPLNLIKIKEPLPPKESKISIPKIFDLVPLAIVTSFIAGMLVNGFFSMASLFMLLQGFDAKIASYFMFCAMIGGLVAQMFIGNISDKLGRKFAIIACASVGFITLLIFMISKPQIYFQYLLAFFMGVGIFCLYSLALARANDVLRDKNKAVEVGRGVLFCYSLGSLISPLILGILMQFFNFSGFIWFYLVNLGFLILFALNKPNILNKKYKKNLGMVTIND